MYKFIRPILFALEAEIAHSLALKALDYIPNYSFPHEENSKVEAMGLEFPHQIGLAAGCDKNGEHINALARLGLSFIEIGTVTPLPQSGNEKPRLFRLPKDEARRALFGQYAYKSKRLDFSGFFGIVVVNMAAKKVAKKVIKN
jgi:dihydroorotate dehydrogenase